MPFSVQENTTSWSTEQLIFSPPGAIGVAVQFKRGPGGAGENVCVCVCVCGCVWRGGVYVKGGLCII